MFPTVAVALSWPAALVANISDAAALLILVLILLLVLLVLVLLLFVLDNLGKFSLAAGQSGGATAGAGGDSLLAVCLLSGPHLRLASSFEARPDSGANWKGLLYCLPCKLMNFNMKINYS